MVKRGSADVQQAALPGDAEVFLIRINHLLSLLPA